jgi:hypothetical protein
MAKIKRKLSDLADGKKKEVYYVAERDGNKLGVTISPFDHDGEQIV